MQLLSLLLTGTNSIFFAVILAVAVFGLSLNRNLGRLFDQLRRDLTQYRDGQGHPQEIAAAAEDYQSALQKTGARPNAQLVVDKLLAGLSVSGLPVGSAERLVRFAASAPVLIGLTGNFWGWVSALGSLSKAWPQVSQDLKPAEMVALLDALREPLSGLNTAFVLSLTGLAVSLVVNLLTHLRSWQAPRDRFAAEMEHYLEHELSAGVTPGDTKELLVSVLGRFGAMADRIEQHVGSMTQNFGPVIERVDTTVAAAGDLVRTMHPIAASVDKAAVSIEQMSSRLETIVGRMESASGTFEGGADALERGLESFGVGIHRLADAQDRSVTLLTDLQSGTAGTLTLLAARLHGLEQVEEKLAATSAHTLEALQSLVNPVAAAATQLKEQYLSLERQTRDLEVSIAQLRSSGAHLEGAATVLHDAQGRFARELEEKLLSANKAQLAGLLDSLNDVNRCITEAHQSFLLNMERTTGSFVDYLSHPVLQDLVTSLQRLTESSGRVGSAHLRR